MTAVPINKALLHFEDDFVRESYSKVIKHITTNHKNLMPYFHFDILSAQKLMIKIHRLNEYGSIKDLLYKTYPLNTYAKKYPQNKGKGLHKSLIILYSKQILEALSYLHSNRWYHMHLHTGNILIEDDGNNIKISELENFVNELPIRNEHFFYYAYENFNSDHYLNNKNDYNSSVLNEIFKNNYNIFEKIDIILFGRVLYEMTTGRELKSPFPDDLEYKELDPEIVEILKLIFNKKTSKVNNNFSITVPEVSASDLLKMKIFGQDSSIYKEENSK